VSRAFTLFEVILAILATVLIVGTCILIVQSALKYLATVNAISEVISVEKNLDSLLNSQFEKLLYLLDQRNLSVVRVKGRVFRIPSNFVGGNLSFITLSPHENEGIQLVVWKLEDNILRLYKLVEEEGDFKIIKESTPLLQNVEQFVVHKGCLRNDQSLAWFSLTEPSEETCFSTGYFFLQLKYIYKNINREFFKVIKIRSNLSG
jgi:hypothetical protein